MTVKKRRKLFAALTAFLIFVTTTGAVMVSAFSVGYTVEVDDTVVGTVAKKSEYYEVLEEVKTEVKDIADVEFEPEGKEAFRVEIVKKSDFTKKEELAENLKSTSEEMIESFSITKDGAFVAALHTEEEAKHILAKYLESRVGTNENITAEFAEQVDVAKTYQPKDVIKTKDAVFAELLKGKTAKHIVLEHETLDDLAETYQVTADAILETNEITKDEVVPGKELIIYTGEPIFSVKTVEFVQERIEIPFETEQKKDAGLYIGRTEIETEGKVGVRCIERYITKIDGVATEEEVIIDEMLEEPVTQVERVGTKKAPPSSGTGSFMMPTSGTLSSPFGARWGRQHAGVDLAAKTGTPIYAADNGVVIVSEHKNNGYGKFITIDHKNGFITNYAHCSELLVKAGDIVKKGDLIAKVGNTGRSTGPHLHFEIRLDGVAKNPYDYIR